MKQYRQSPVKKQQLVSPILLGYLLAVSAFVLMVVLPLFQGGTFIDGMLYKTVAYNHACANSTFWAMKFTNTSMRFFCEQPPLYFFMLGTFYKLFGMSLFSDRSFTLVLFILQAYVSFKIVKRGTSNHHFFFVLIQLLLLSIPVLCWSYVNQVIEPLLCLFTASGIFIFQKYTGSNKFYYSLAFGLLLVLMFLTKGFQSCFLVVLPFAYFLLSRKSSKILYFSMVSAGVLVVGIFVFIQLYTPSINWFDCYYQARLLLTMDNVGATTDYHAEIVIRFFSELLVLLIMLCFLCVYFSKKKNYPVRFIFKNFLSHKLAVALLLTALAGSLPYTLSLVQRGFYLLPAFVCVVFAMVLGLKRYWLFVLFAWRRFSTYKWGNIIVVGVFTFSVIFCLFNVNKFKRDAVLTHDVQLMLPYLAKGDTIWIKDDLWNYFSLHALFYTNKEVNLSGEKSGQRFLITKKGSLAEEINYARLPVNTGELDLWVKQGSSNRSGK